MQVIVTHANTDFDAFAAMLAARRLYPDAVIALSGSLNRNVRDFYRLHAEELGIAEAGRVDPAEVERLIVVETSQPERLGEFEAAARSAEVEVVLFDHHAGEELDWVRPENAVRSEDGALTTTMVAILAERDAAQAQEREPRLLELLQSWGGVTIAYRRRLVDAPSYTLNHEEVEKALEEGISFAEGLSPSRIEVDQFGHACAVRFAQQGGSEVELPARSVLVAAGTQPNTVLGREDPSHFKLDGKYFETCDPDGNPVKPERAISKPRPSPSMLPKRRARKRNARKAAESSPPAKLRKPWPSKRKKGKRKPRGKNANSRRRKQKRNQKG